MKNKMAKEQRKERQNKAKFAHVVTGWGCDWSKYSTKLNSQASRILPTLEISLQSCKGVHIIRCNFNETEFRDYVQIINSLYFFLTNFQMFSLILSGLACPDTVFVSS